MSTAFTVYGHFQSQPASRVTLFLSMAGEAYAYRHVDLKAGQQKTPEYLAISPFGRVPALRHGDVTLAESGVILSYLAEKTGRFGSDDDAEHWRIQQWLSWMADVLLPVQRARACRLFGRDPDARATFDAAAASGLARFDQHLTDRAFVEGGRVTIADLFVFPWIDLLHESGIDRDTYPALAAWHARMLEQPGCKGHYDLLPTGDVG